MMIKIKNTTLSFLVLTGMLGGSSTDNCRDLGQTDCENADGCQASFIRDMFLECVPTPTPPTSCRVLSSQDDCESVRGCRFAGRCRGFREGNNCEILSQSDCENSRFCRFSGSCFGTPRTGTAEAEAEGEALLSLEAAADDPTNHGICLGLDTWNTIGCESLLSRSDCENATFCLWRAIPFGNSAEAEEEALLGLEAAADDPNYERTRTNLRGWNQDQEQELQRLRNYYLWGQAKISRK